MSEWKNRVKEPVSDDSYCTGWNMIDGFLQIINSLKKNRKEKKAKKTNKIKKIS